MNVERKGTRVRGEGLAFGPDLKTYEIRLSQIQGNLVFGRSTAFLFHIIKKFIFSC